MEKAKQKRSEELLQTLKEELEERLDGSLDFMLRICEQVDEFSKQDIIFWENSDDNINEQFSDCTPWEIICSTHGKDYQPHDDYFWFDGYANIVSGDLEAVLDRVDTRVLMQHLEQLYDLDEPANISGAFYDLLVSLRQMDLTDIIDEINDALSDEEEEEESDDK